MFECFRKLTRFWKQTHRNMMPKLMNTMNREVNMTIVFFIQLNHKIRPLTK